MKTQKTQHTPGPWRVRHGVNEAFIDAPPIVCLAVVNSLCDLPKAVAECKANARLIAAAPELLAALRWVVGDDNSDEPCMVAGRAAIEKATLCSP
jgi:hypothetical protein